MKKFFSVILLFLLIAAGVYFFTNPAIMIKEIEVQDIYINDMGIENDIYYYEMLDDTQKKYYRIIAQGVMNLKENITMEITKDKNYEEYRNNVEISLNAFLADHPEVFFVNDGYEVSLIDGLVVKILKLKLNYISNDIEEIDKMEDELKKEINEISEKTRYYESEYEKEIFIHDSIAESLSYYEYENYEDIPSIKHTAYGALVEGSAVCDGITKAFQLVLAKANIDSIFVTGTTDEVAHAWNKVKIDGDYYNVDLTSNKTLGRDNNSLVIHSYFNITDEEILNTHTIDKNENLPKCIATKYNYYLYNDYEITFMDSFEYKLESIVDSQKSKGLIEIRIIGISDTPSELITGLYNINFNNYKTNNITKVKYHKVNDNYIIVK